MIALTNLKHLKPYLDSIFDAKKEAKSELLDLDIATYDDGNITTIAAIARFKNAPKKEEVKFHENFVRIGYKMYPILTDNKVTVTPTCIGTFISTEQGDEYISRDGKKLYIKKDFQGNKFLKA